MFLLSLDVNALIRPRILKLLNMTSKVTLERVKQNADVTKRTIQELKDELSELSCSYNNILAQQLREENARLQAAVEAAKQRLIHEEVKRGIPQIPLPSKTQNESVTLSVSDQKETVPKTVASCTVLLIENKTEETPAGTQEKTDKKAAKEAKPKKEKKPKEAKEVAAELPVDIGRLDLRIGKVEDVQRHPDADSLYVLKINCGDEKLRTVCSGLVKHIPIEELSDRDVMVLCNLKPVKMRGITSEAMVMCASSEQGVEVLTPPKGCTPGEHVHCEGYTRQPDAVMNPKKKIFETVAPDLHTNDNLEACYKGVPLKVPEKGNVVSKSLKNVPVK